MSYEESEEIGLMSYEESEKTCLLNSEKLKKMRKKNNFLKESLQGNLKTANLYNSTPNLNRIPEATAPLEGHHEAVMVKFDALRIEHFKEEIKYLKNEIHKLLKENSHLKARNSLNGSTGTFAEGLLAL